MDNNFITEYLKITSNAIPSVYPGPEEQAKQIVKCSILKDVNLEYNNLTSRTQPNFK